MGFLGKLFLDRSEISNLESWKHYNFDKCSDLWIHDSTFYGDLKGVGAEGGITMSGINRLVYEFNHTETPNWQPTLHDEDQFAIRMINANPALPQE